jgi:class 3 adenylate cyclase
LKRTKLPIDKGIVGRVFASGLANRVSNAPSDPDFFDGIDRKGDHETRALLTLPACRDGQSIGVVQFLNKPTGFSDEDEAVAGRMVAAVSPKIAAFVNVPENFQALDIAWRTDRKEATIAFCDLTSSTSLLSQMSVPSAIDCINEYLELQCDIAMDSGATVDKYTGDGVMLRFNVPRPIRSGDHVITAVEAAIRMRETYRRLRAGWLVDGLPVGSTFSRIALACGDVYEATIGHPQFQQITVIGAPVNAAANMCDSAPRDRDVIVIDEQVRARVDGSFAIQFLDMPGGPQTMYELS